jgi:RNA polymerase sigma-70 factor (ECF subfamily)
MAGTGEIHTAEGGGEQAGPVSDADLLERICDGDRVAFTALAERYHMLVYRVAVRVLGNAADAEDVSQEAFIKLWNRPPDLRKKTAVRAWLLQVARNLAIDRLRRARNASDDGLELVHDDATAPDGLLRHEQAAARVVQALSGLPERQRTALQLTYYEGLSNQETAEVMEASVEAIESLLSRARRGLRTELASVWTELVSELEQLK